MYITVNKTAIYAYTSGKLFDAAKPTLVFIHGVLNDHSVWILQTRYFAHHGFNVLAVDLPGHGKSEGNCPKSVEEAAEFVLALLDAVGVQKAALIGHSWGSLIALHAASLAPERVSQLALVGTAFPMKVSPALLDTSLNQPMKAIEMVNTFSHSTMAPPPSALGPGTWLYGGSRALMRRVLASNPRENLFHTGFKACDSYENAFEALNRLFAGKESAQSAILFIVGIADQMTTPKAAQSLIDKAPGAKVARVSGGHQMMAESPEEVLQALTAFLKI
ncbi:alpha/beta hydrolase [Variovorax sp. PCZ-1]|uniref:alpha/beta fold hydrolase n=1 Tax=Variovorax sp. PCZ-1 TaxID=2835533 RepID=UPI001BCC110B|nr:alpha/beta hydrolase [Variovorax sp. PCZ-1]MBS7807055.1 alpha/beta hydrolase [Variovorax sp. PCZ-1]